MKTCTCLIELLNRLKNRSSKILVSFPQNSYSFLPPSMKQHFVFENLFLNLWPKALSWKLGSIIFWLIYVPLLSLHLQYTNRLAPSFKRSSSGKDLYSYTKSLSTASWSRGFPPGGTAQCVTGSDRRSLCKPGGPVSLQLSITSHFVPLSACALKGQTLKKNTCSINHLEYCSRHIFRRDAVSFVCTVHPGKRVSLPKSNLAFSQVFSVFFFLFF